MVKPKRSFYKRLGCKRGSVYIIMVGQLLKFYVLIIIKVISGWVRTWGSAQSRLLYSDITLEMSKPLTWSHDSDTEPNSLCPIIIIPNAWLDINSYVIGFIRLHLKHVSINPTICPNGRWAINSFGRRNQIIPL